MSHQTNTMNISSSSKHYTSTKGYSSRPLSTKNLFRPIGSNHSHSRMYRSFGKSRSLCLFAYLRLELSSLVNPFWNLKPRCLWCLQTRPRINFNSLSHLLDPCFNPFDVLTSSTRIQLTGRNLPEISWSYQYLSMSLLLSRESVLVRFSASLLQAAQQNVYKKTTGQELSTERERCPNTWATWWNC